MTGQRDFSLLVAFGTDMGNAEDAAMTFAETVATIGVKAEAVELNQLDVAELQSAADWLEKRKVLPEKITVADHLANV